MVDSGVERLLRREGVKAGSIEVVGALPFDRKLFQQFADADVLVLPSRSEGTPRVLVEARAFGFPKREIQWGPGGGESSLIEEALAAALDPIEFEYGFFQATGGVVFSF